MRRSVKRGVILVGVLAALLAGAAVAWRVAGRSLIEGAIIRALADRGVAVETLTLRSVGVGSAVLGDLRIDIAGGVTIERVDADYGWSELLFERRIERLVVTGLRVALTRPAAWPERAAGAAGPTAIARIPVGTLRLSDGRAALATPLGRVDLAVDLEARTRVDGGLAVAGLTVLRGESGAVEIPLEADLSASGRFALTASAQDGRLVWPGGTASLERGRLELEGTPSGIDRGAVELAGMLSTADGRSVDLTASASLSGGEGPLRLAASVTPPGGGPGPAIRLAGDLALDAGGARLGLGPDSRIAWPDGPDGGTAVLRLGPDPAAPFAVAVADGWTLSASGPYRFEDGAAALDGTVDLSLAADTGAQGVVGRYAVAVGAAGRLADGTAIAGARADLAGMVAPRDGGGLTVEVEAGTGTLVAPGPGIAVDGVAATLAVDAPDPTVPVLILRDATVRALGTPAWFAPLRLSGEARVVEAGRIAFRGTGRMAAGAVGIAVTGLHDPGSGAGRMDMTVDPVSFAPGVRQPDDLSPALAGLPLDAVTGGIAATGAIAWGDGFASSAEIGLDDVTLTAFGATFRGIDGTLSADSLVPFSLPDGQVLALSGADLGLTLGEGAVAFGLSGDGRLRVQGVGFGLAGGSVAVAPFETELGSGERDLVLVLYGLELAGLSQQLAIEGLSLTGRVDGRLPIRLIEDTIEIENGVVQATEPGVIRYVATSPLGPPGESGVGLLVAAVRNFQYDGLRATVNGRTGEDLEVAIRLTGANPEVYDGFPIALNVTLTGALDQVLRSGLRTMAIGDEAGALLRGE